jgi:hypothetical protein
VISDFKIASVKKTGTYLIGTSLISESADSGVPESGMLEPRAAAPGLLFGLGLGKSAENLLAFLPAAVLLEDVDAFETLQDVSLFPDASGGLQTGMLGHFKSPLYQFVD